MLSPNASQSSSLDSRFSKRMDKAYASKIYGKFQYRWTCHREYIVTVMCFMLSTDVFVKFTKVAKTDPNILHHLLAYIFFALPMYYMQVFIGQYTQSGIFFIKYMIPLAGGLAYVYLITIAIQLVITGVFLTDNIMYLLLTLQDRLPWLHCQHDSNISCVSTTNESNGTGYLSGYVYWRYVYMKSPAMEIENVKIGLITVQRFISLNVSWFIIFTFMTFAYKRRQLVLDIFSSLLCLCISVLCVRIIMSPASTPGITKLFKMDFEEFVNLETWITALSYAAWQLTLGEAIHMLSGARMDPTDSSGFLCLGCTMLAFFFCIMGAIITHGATSIAELNTDLELLTDTYFIADMDAIKWYVLIPQGLGHLDAAHVWTFLHFLGCCSLLIANTITHIITIQLNITNSFPFMFQYRVYLLALYCFLGIILGAGILPQSQFALTAHFIHNSTLYIEVFAACFMSIMVFWIYGVTKLSDDIHFITGHQPTMFWKICWYISPALLMVMSAYHICTSFKLPLLLRIFDILPFGLFIGPVLGIMVYNIFVYIKKRRFIGLLQPHAEWGPADHTERHMRLICNPRTEVKSKSRRPVCHHKCILNSKELKTIIAKEVEKRKEISKIFRNISDI